MAARNRTMDSAPTRPSDNATEDLTTAMTPMVANVSNGNTRASDSESEGEELHRLYRKRI